MTLEQVAVPITGGGLHALRKGHALSHSVRRIQKKLAILSSPCFLNWQIQGGPVPSKLG